jgi:chemotaxis protein CheC
MELSKLQLDALKEIGTVGAGNAATSLSKMLGKRVNITVPLAQVIPIEKVPELLGSPEELVTAVIFEIDDDVNGAILLMYSMAEAKKLAALLTSKPIDEVKIMDEFLVSALKEMGNVTTGAYLNALAAITNLRITHSIPNYASDMLMSIMDGILIRLSLEAEDAVVVETEFSIEENKVHGYILFIPDPEGLQVILKTLGLGGQQS